MKINKRSDLLEPDIQKQILTNLDGALQFKNLNKIQWNNLTPEDRATFFMQNVFHDGVDPRIKDYINQKIDEQVDGAKESLLKKIDQEVRNSTMSAVVKQLVEGLNFDEI